MTLFQQRLDKKKHKWFHQGPFPVNLSQFKLNITILILHYYKFKKNERNIQKELQRI